jgi:hypothetical protein
MDLFVKKIDIINVIWIQQVRFNRKWDKLENFDLHSNLIPISFIYIDIHPSERYFRPIILESSISNNQDLLKRNPLIQVHEKPLLSNVISSSSNELFSAFTYISSPKVPTKKPTHNDQSSTSADSGVHSTYTQSPRCPLHNISFDRSLITNQTNPLYEAYDEIVFPKPEQYSLV